MYLHPSVKHIMQEQIGENKLYDRPLRYYLANFAEGFHLSLTTYQCPKQRKSGL